MGSRAIGLGEQRRTESALIWRRRHRGLRVLGEAAGAPASKKSEVGCGGRSRDGRKPTRLEEGNASRRAEEAGERKGSMLDADERALEVRRDERGGRGGEGGGERELEEGEQKGEAYEDPDTTDGTRPLVRRDELVTKPLAIFVASRGQTSGSAEPISCFHDCQGFAGCLAVPLLCAGCSTTVGRRLPAAQTSGRRACLQAQALRRRRLCMRSSADQARLPCARVARCARFCSLRFSRGRHAGKPRRRVVALCTDVSQKSVKLNSANKQRGFLNMQGWLHGMRAGPRQHAGVRMLLLN